MSDSVRIKKTSSAQLQSTPQGLSSASGASLFIRVPHELFRQKLPSDAILFYLHLVRLADGYSLITLSNDQIIGLINVISGITPKKRGVWKKRVFSILTEFMGLEVTPHADHSITFKTQPAPDVLYTAVPVSILTRCYWDNRLKVFYLYCLSEQNSSGAFTLTRDMALSRISIRTEYYTEAIHSLKELGVLRVLCQPQHTLTRHSPGRYQMLPERFDAIVCLSEADAPLVSSHVRSLKRLRERDPVEGPWPVDSCPICGFDECDCDLTNLMIAFGVEQ